MFCRSRMRLIVMLPFLALAMPSSGRAQTTEAPSQEDVVRGLITQYQQAMEKLDVQALRAVWPRVDQRALTRAFAQLERQQIDFAQCWISLAGERATANCTGNVEFVPKVGSGTPRSEGRDWEFAFARADERWHIDRVESHQ